MAHMIASNKTLSSKPLQPSRSYGPPDCTQVVDVSSPYREGFSPLRTRATFITCRNAGTSRTTIPSNTTGAFPVRDLKLVVPYDDDEERDDDVSAPSKPKSAPRKRARGASLFAPAGAR